MFNVGDTLNFGFFTNVEVIGISGKNYILKDKQGNEKKVYIELVNKYGKKTIPDK